MDSQAQSTEGNQKEELNDMKINKSLKDKAKEKETKEDNRSLYYALLKVNLKNAYF